MTRTRAQRGGHWLAVSALLTLLAATSAAQSENAQKPAIHSKLATKSLLLDVARAGERLVAVGEWGHVVLSDDGGETWRQAESVPVRITLTAVCFADAERGWAVGHDAVVIHTRDGGETWELQYEDPDAEAPLLSVWFEDTRRGFAAGAFATLLETRDGGATWERRTLEVDSDIEPHLNAIFRGPGDTLFIPAESGSVFRSRDLGKSWDFLEVPYEGSFWGGLRVDGGAIVVFGMRGHVFRSEDLGDTWREIKTGTDQSIQAATTLKDGTILLVGLGGAVLTSRDGGENFSAAIEADRRGLASVVQGNDGQLLLFGEMGVRKR